MSINRRKQPYFDERSNKVCFINNINNILLYSLDFMLSYRLTRQKCLANTVLFTVRRYNICIYCMISADTFRQSDTAFARIQFMNSLGNACFLALNLHFSVKKKPRRFVAKHCVFYFVNCFIYFMFVCI